MVVAKGARRLNGPIENSPETAQFAAPANAAGLVGQGLLSESAARGKISGL
jgi:hypothetical protein